MRHWPNFKGKVSVNSSTNRSQVLTNSRSSTGPIESSPGCFVECGSEHDRQRIDHGRRCGQRVRRRLPRPTRIGHWSPRGRRKQNETGRSWKRSGRMRTSRCRTPRSLSRRRRDTLEQPVLDGGERGACQISKHQGDTHRFVAGRDARGARPSLRSCSSKTAYSRNRLPHGSS